MSSVECPILSENGVMGSNAQGSIRKELDELRASIEEKIGALSSQILTNSLQQGADLKISSRLSARLLQTFGSEESGAQWLRQSCGDLNNLSPLEYLRAQGSEAELERILDCIDHGVFA